MSAFSIHIQIDAEFEAQASADALRHAVEQALLSAGTQGPLGMSLVVTDEASVHALNEQYLGHDEPTDVLSFASEGDDMPREAGEPPYMGDVLIAYPVAERQAALAGHSTAAELRLLAVHGTLHLLGYDHETPEDKARMWSVQDAALAAVADEG